MVCLVPAFDWDFPHCYVVVGHVCCTSDLALIRDMGFLFVFRLCGPRVRVVVFTATHILNLSPRSFRHVALYPDRRMGEFPSPVVY